MPEPDRSTSRARRARRVTVRPAPRRSRRLAASSVPRHRARRRRPPAGAPVRGDPARRGRRQDRASGVGHRDDRPAPSRRTTVRSSPSPACAAGASESSRTRWSGSGIANGQHVGGVVGQITDTRAPVTPDEAAKSAIAAGDGAPRTVEAEVTIRHRPGNVRVVDERGTPGRQDLVERIGGSRSRA